jgi:hypothetical protein
MDQDMDIDKLQARLRDIDVDVPQATLRRWAYDKREIIPRPERYSHGPKSGKSGRAAKWSEEDFLEAAAVWAVSQVSDNRGHPPLDLIPHIKSYAKRQYESPMASYGHSVQPSDDLTSPKEVTREEIRVEFGFPSSLGKQPAGWQELLRTWIVAIEKAKRGISIKEPKQVRFHWESEKKDGRLMDYVPKRVNDDNVSLHPSESGHDEIIVIIDGSDFRETAANIFSGKYRIVDQVDQKG